LLKKIAVICAERISKYLTEEKLRGKIARDLHDNMGSALSSISVYGQIAKLYNQQQRKEDLEQTLNKINETSSEMINEMNDIVWAINPRNDNMDAILQRMESFAKPLLASKNISFNFQYYAGILNFHLEVTKRKNFFLIFKEAINNAVKYADCKHVSVRIEHSGNHFCMTISDNGKRFLYHKFFRRNQVGGWKYGKWFKKYAVEGYRNERNIKPEKPARQRYFSRIGFSNALIRGYIKG
jgi:signal transduction histidine kinase